jgi:hypothetical protein
MALHNMKIESLDPTLSLRSDLGSGVSDRAKSLLERELEELGPGDIAFCVRQSIALPHVTPIALKFASRQPLAETEFYDGDLLMSLLEAAARKALTEPQLRELRDICSEALAAVTMIVETVEPAAKSFMDAYDHQQPK